MASQESFFIGTVTHLSRQGYGLVKDPAGVSYFVRGAWRGDKGRFHPSDERDGDYGFAEMMELLEASSERRPAACPHLGSGDTQCFGCPWMMVDYAAQLEEKQHRVVYALERVGLRDVPVQTIWPSPSLYHYRRRAQFKTDGQMLGYAGRQGLCIAPIEQCLVLTPGMQSHLTRLRARLPESRWRPEGAHIWNYLDLDEESDPEQIPLNRRRPFQQANAAQNQAMRRWLRDELSARSRAEPILELFAGSGNFTEVLRDLDFQKILALEVGAEAVAELQKNLGATVGAQRMDLYGRRAAEAVAQMAKGSRILLANPPRAGLAQLWRLSQLLPELHTILIVSCDPGSFASDARRLSEQGFKLQSVQPLDQMPHTPHVEIVARFQRLPR